MKVSEIFPSAFITAGDLDGKDVSLTVAEVFPPNTLAREDKKLIDKPAVSFKETPKRFILGKTNARLIRMTHGNTMESWIGKKITLYPTTTEMARAAAEQAGCMILGSRGKMVTVPCIRCRVTSSEMGGMN